MSGLIEFRTFNNSACKSVLNIGGLFETLEGCVKRITVVEFEVNNGCSNGCFGVEVRAKVDEYDNTIPPVPA